MYNEHRQAENGRKNERKKAMTEKQFDQIKEKMPAGEKIKRTYRAFEGDLRVITEDERGTEKRYSVKIDDNGNAYAVEF